MVKDTIDFSFNTPRLLSNPAYYHKLISCNTFIYLSKIAANRSKQFNTLKVGSLTTQIPYIKPKRDSSLFDVHFAKGWNSDDGEAIKLLRTYRNSDRCKYKERLDALIDTLQEIPTGTGYAKTVQLIDSFIVCLLFNIARKPLNHAPHLAFMHRRTDHTKSIDRISALIKQTMNGFYPVNLRVGLSTYKAGLEVKERPVWIKSVECQTLVNDVKFSDSIVTLIGEYDDPYSTILEHYSFRPIEDSYED
ncbi:WbqC-like family protein [Vibrio phage vB_VneS_J26]